MVKKLSVMVFLIFWPLFSDQKFSDGLIGPNQISHSGGGIARSAGVEAGLSNPAGILIEQGESFFLGAADLSQGFPPLIHIGKRTNEVNAYALTFFRSEERGPDSVFQAVMGSFSIITGQIFSLGAGVFTKLLPGRYAADLNGGVLYRPFSFLRVGARINNIFASYLGDSEDSLRLARSMGAGIHVQTPYRVEFLYDITGQTWQGEQSTHIAGWEIEFGQAKKTRLFHSLRLVTIEGGELDMSGGIQFSVPLGGSLMHFQYSLGNIALNYSGSGLRQAASLSLDVNLFVDRTPPYVLVEEPRGYLTPSHATEAREALFSLQAKDSQSPLQKWTLVLSKVKDNGEPGEIVRSFSGSGLPPKFLRWGGRDSFQNLLPKGYYTYRLIAQDKQGNIAKTRWKLIEIRD